MLPITDITTFSFQDFPEHTSCIIWFGGCNFRCPYCHNPEFVISKFHTIEEEKVFEFLESRVGLLDGVVLSGGECTISNELYDFIKKIKKMGFLVKIDTNGTNFGLVKKLIDEKLIDFIALDYKSPREKFASITNTDSYDEFKKTLEYSIKSNIKMEVRTTIHTALLNENDLNQIIDDLEKLNYKHSYFIQNFRNDNGRKTLGNICDQEIPLDINLVKKKSFEVLFRNFF